MPCPAHRRQAADAGRYAYDSAAGLTNAAGQTWDDAMGSAYSNWEVGGARRLGLAGLGGLGWAARAAGRAGLGCTGGWAAASASAAHVRRRLPRFLCHQR